MNGRRNNAYPKKSYADLYTEASQKFWELQQIPQTPEEKEFENLIRQLGKMLSEFRSEIEDLENENAKLQERVENIDPIKDEWNNLRSEETYLKQLKAELESASRMYN